LIGAMLDAHTPMPVPLARKIAVVAARGRAVDVMDARIR
jgi:hypothetical protein